MQFTNNTDRTSRTVQETKIDLHFHSRHSDGALWPAELAIRLQEQSVGIAALTDHDTLQGVPCFLEEARKLGIRAIAAVEIDFTDTDYGFESEILGYFPKCSYENTQKYLEEFQKNRSNLAHAALEKAATRWKNQSISHEGLILYKSGGHGAVDVRDAAVFSISKYDIFGYLHSLGLVSDDYGPFKTEFFSDAEFERYGAKPEFSRCIEVIRQDGGFPVLAHPGYQWKKDASAMFAASNIVVPNLRKAKEHGLWGIECHAYQSPESAITINQVVKGWATEAGLHLTCGSDFHRDNEKNYPNVGCCCEALPTIHSGDLIKHIELALAEWF